VRRFFPYMWILWSCRVSCTSIRGSRNYTTDFHLHDIDALQKLCIRTSSCNSVIYNNSVPNLCSRNFCFFHPISLHRSRPAPTRRRAVAGGPRGSHRRRGQYWARVAAAGGALAVELSRAVLESSGGCTTWAVGDDVTSFGQLG